MSEMLSLGYSPCPNDTFIFFAMSQGLVDTGSIRFNLHLADVEELNRKARKRELDITKVSIGALRGLMDDYLLLRSGGAMGRGCGPLVVARESIGKEELLNSTVAIPGKLTTAFLLFKLYGEHSGAIVEMAFDQIMPAVASGKVDAGLIIHEGRFTYPVMGLKLIVDLGEWWEQRTGLPIPLGGIVVKRSLGSAVASKVEEQIRQSIAYAQIHPAEAWPYIRSLAQEMEPDVIHQHIEMFVNDFSLDLGDQGEEAIRVLLQASAGRNDITALNQQLFGD